jgi:hypothetical protein
MTGSAQVTRKPYPSDATDEEWTFVMPYLALMPGLAAATTHLPHRTV